MGYSFRLSAWVLLYAPSHRQDSTYHGLCYTSRGALAGTRNSFVIETHNNLITFSFNHVITKYIYIYIYTHSQTLLIQTPIFRKPHHMDGWTIKQNSHFVNLFVSLDIQLLDPDSYIPQQSVKNKDNLLNSSLMISIGYHCN